MSAPCIIGGYNTISRLYGKRLWGAPSFGFRRVPIKLTFGIASTYVTDINIAFNIVCRFKSTEPTIEDIYSYATDRFMRLKGLDGPLFPFFTKDGDE